jgi:hypothetical protein
MSPWRHAGGTKVQLHIPHTGENTITTQKMWFFSYYCWVIIEITLFHPRTLTQLKFAHISVYLKVPPFMVSVQSFSSSLLPLLYPLDNLFLPFLLATHWTSAPSRLTADSLMCFYSTKNALQKKKLGTLYSVTVLAHLQNLILDLCKWHQWCQKLFRVNDFCVSTVFGDDDTTEDSPKEVTMVTRYMSPAVTLR